MKQPGCADIDFVGVIFSSAHSVRTSFRRLPPAAPKITILDICPQMWFRSLVLVLSVIGFRIKLGFRVRNSTVTFHAGYDWRY